MSSRFDSEVNARRNASPCAEIDPERMLRRLAWRAEGKEVELKVNLRGDVASRMWFELRWRGADAKEHFVAASDFDLLLWRAATVEAQIDLGQKMKRRQELEGLPSAEDLDRVAEEQLQRERTSSVLETESPSQNALGAKEKWAALCSPTNGREDNPDGTITKGERMLKSPLRWVGGKSKVREQIIAKFPEHQCYVELFSGAAWVLFGKPPETSKSEVLNDLDGELINFWRVIKHRPAEFTEAASWLLASRELFDEFKQFPGVSGEITKAVQFYAVIRMAFGARRMGSNFGMRQTGRPTIFWPQEKLEVQRVINRLRVCWVERLTWDKCVANYDRKTTFFYVDPPYRVEGAKAYRHYFSDEDHAKLADVLRGSVKGKWLLSYNDDSFIRQLYRGKGVTIEHLMVPYTVARKKKKIVRELLVRNY